MENLAVGVDLGGTKIRIAFINREGKVKLEKTIPTNVPGGQEAILSDILSSIRNLESQLSNEKNIAIGLAVAGQVDKASGNIKFAPNLHWHNVQTTTLLREALHLPVIIANDVRAATWGEMCFGAGKGAGDIVCIFFGTGIGGGIVSEGVLLAGDNNSAGEVGHMIIDYKGNLCSCGSRGCWESVAGGWAISKNAQEEIKKNPSKGTKILEHAQGKLENVKATDLFEAANEGDSFALELVNNIEQGMIAGAVSLVNAINPQMLILGGGIIDRDPWLVEIIERGVRKLALRSATEKLIVSKSQCGSDAPVLGISAMAMDLVKGG